jgi:hypothetical protein
MLNMETLGRQLRVFRIIFRTCLNSSLAVIYLCEGMEPRPASTGCVRCKEQICCNLYVLSQA